MLLALRATKHTIWCDGVTIRLMTRCLPGCVVFWLEEAMVKWVVELGAPLQEFELKMVDFELE